MTSKIAPVIKFTAHLILGRKRGKLKRVAAQKRLINGMMCGAGEAKCTMT